MVRKRYEINVWGTVLFLDVGSSKIDEAAIDAAVEAVKKFVYGVDEDFSTYIDGSFVSRLRRGEISIEQCPADVQEVWQLCAVARARAPARVLLGAHVRRYGKVAWARRAVRRGLLLAVPVEVVSTAVPR